MSSWPFVWGATPAEVAASHPADEHAEAGSVHAVRAIDVDAEPEVVFRWLCQLKVAPYSYDLVDNLGRRSPRQLTPGAERLELGQRFLMITRLVAFEPGRSLTGATSASRLLGRTVMSYQVAPGLSARSRIVACLAVPGRTRSQRLRAAAFAAGDLVMMRRQLRTLRDLAEVSPGPPP